jgi:hypothetical protein
MIARSSRLGALALCLGAAACGSHADNVCGDVDDCSQGGSYNWLQSCQAEAQELSDQANASGCGALFNAYYGCADSAYQCTGITSSFPGCDAQLASLQACLVASPSQSACVALSVKESTCPGDGGASAVGPISTPCTLAEQCEAHCYLDQVANPCAPTPADLDALTQCTQACPPSS